MGQYFFKMSKAERENILDKHKTIYDGYVTEYGNPKNEQPLYVQDFANDKNGITVSNTGDVKEYMNMNINEDIDRRDRIGDGPYDLEGGTVDLEGGTNRMTDVNRYHFGDKYPSPNENEFDYISVGIEDECKDCEEDYIDIALSELGEDFEFDIDRNFEEDLAGPIKKEVSGDSYKDMVDGDELPDFLEKLNESLDMFKRFKRYN